MSQPQTQTLYLNACYIGRETRSGFRDIAINDGPGPYGSINVVGQEKFFPDMDLVAEYRTTVTTPTKGDKFCIYYDKTMHNDGTDNCPYLFIKLDKEDRPVSVTEEELMGIAFALEEMKLKCPRSSE